MLYVQGVGARRSATQLLGCMTMWSLAAIGCDPEGTEALANASATPRLPPISVGAVGAESGARTTREILAWAEGQRLVLQVAGSVEAARVRASDFKLLGTHANLDFSVAPTVRNDTVRNEDGEPLTTIEFQLDDSVTSHDAPVLDYFMPGGTLASDDARFESFQLRVDNRTVEYEGDREVVQLEPGTSIQDALGPSRLILLRRGEVYLGDFAVEHEAVTISAWGPPDAGPPIIEGEGNASAVIRVRADHFRLANAMVRAHGQSGIAVTGTASFAFITGNELVGDDSRDRKGIWLVVRQGRENAWGEGNWALNNRIVDFEDGITARMRPADLDPESANFVPWTQRRLGGSHTPIRVELNDIWVRAFGGGEGDGIAVGRGGYFGSYVRRNRIRGWADDGLDAYGAREVIFEYNVLDNQNAILNPRGSGNGLKMGGDGGDVIDEQSGDNIFRYNLVRNRVNVRMGLDPEDVAIAYGMTTNAVEAPLRPTLVYGNAVLGSPGQALQFSNTIGEGWVVVHNLLWSSTPDGYAAFSFRTELAGLYFRNNLLVGRVHRPIADFEEMGHNLVVDAASEVLADPEALSALRVRGGSPSVDTAGRFDALRELYLHDFRGTPADPPDFGPVEYWGDPRGSEGQERVDPPAE